jgi:hypothetical protein
MPQCPKWLLGRPHIRRQQPAAARIQFFNKFDGHVDLGFAAAGHRAFAICGVILYGALFLLPRSSIPDFAPLDVLRPGNVAF